VKRPRPKINEALRDFLPQSNDELKELLSRKIQTEGPVEPIRIAPDGDIVDGFTRYELYEELKIKKFRVEVVHGLKTIEDKKAWMRDHQLGRRNLSPSQWNYYYGLKFNEEKLPAHRPSEEVRQNVGVLSTGETASRLADESGKDARTIERAGQFAEAVDQQPAKVRGALIAGAVPMAVVVKAEGKPLFCRRCLRVGAPVRDCPECDKLRETVKKWKKPNDKPKPGSSLIKWKNFYAAIGVVIRLSDSVHEHYKDAIEGTERGNYEAACELILRLAKAWKQRAGVE
jgi:hypothetical protein